MSRDPIVRFLQFAAVGEPDECWEWTGHRKAGGYGSFVLNGRSERAHRASFIFFHGPIPTGMYVCHRCDNPGCVNPDHLFVGTATDNMQDMLRKGRGKIGEQHGRHKLTEAQVVEIKEALPTVSQLSLSRKYGVSGHTIHAISRGWTWAHING